MIKPQKYRKKPVVIEAWQFDGSNAKEIALWANKNTDAFNRIVLMSETLTLHIQTLEGELNISKGDYIIKGVQGEFYPCKPDIFKATYELVTPQSTTKGKKE